MRILQINSVYNYGSTGRITKILHEGLLAANFESYVIYGRGPLSDDIGTFRIRNRVEQLGDLCLTRFFNRHGEGNTGSSRKMLCLIDELKPDVVHLHNIHGYYVNYSMLLNYLAERQIPVIWLFHDTWPISGSSAINGYKLGDFTEASIESLCSVSHEYPAHLPLASYRSPENYVKKINLIQKLNATLVSPSHWMDSILGESPLKGMERRVIHNGISLEDFKPYEDSISPDGPIQLLAVANVWEERKGLPELIKLRQDLDASYHLTIIGLQPKQIQDLPEGITGLERTSSVEELARYYSRADLLVNPTTQDNFPTVNIEAQACGTPVLTYDTGGAKESLTQETGKAVAQQDYAALLEAVRQTPKKTAETVRACVANSQRYSKENMVAAYLSLYRESGD